MINFSDKMVRKNVVIALGMLFFLGIVVLIVSPINLAGENFEEGNPYERLLEEINNSLADLSKNKEQNSDILSEIEDTREGLEDIITAHENLKNRMVTNKKYLDSLSDKIEKVNGEEDSVKRQLEIIVRDLEENKRIYSCNGEFGYFIYLSLLILAIFNIFFILKSFEKVRL